MLCLCILFFVSLSENLSRSQPLVVEYSEFLLFRINLMDCNFRNKRLRKMLSTERVNIQSHRLSVTSNLDCEMLKIIKIFTKKL